MKKRYLDSSVFIYPLLYSDKKSKDFERVLYDLAKGKFYGFTSTLTWDEVFYVLKKKRGRDLALEECEKFLKFPNLRFLDAGISVVSEAQNLVSKYSVGPRDSIHVATSLKQEIKEIVSPDKDFDKFKEVKRINV